MKRVTVTYLRPARRAARVAEPVQLGEPEAQRDAEAEREQRDRARRRALAQLWRERFR